MEAAEDAEAGRAGRATLENWMYPPPGGWTWDQVTDAELPFDWELLDGSIVVQGLPVLWHNRVRDRLYYQLESACREPFAVGIAPYTVIDDHNVPKPDVMVFDESQLDIDTVAQVPGERVALAVEVMSEGSRHADRFSKPTLYAEAGIRSYWRIERAEGGLPVVYEFRLHHETGIYETPRPMHTGRFVTSAPFPVDIDFGTLIEV
ncbi:Uma2 family endonuclease [Streptomyces chrestomyceticus]|uniref:Uma2 family endonuclease n=1 Tax=Streptomyces chrestomyceticus TaxID=68185 RepID=UPI0033CE2510